jgi:hypothetical protein
MDILAGPPSRAAIEIWRSRLPASEIAGRRSVGADPFAEQCDAKGRELGRITRPAPTLALAPLLTILFRNLAESLMLDLRSSEILIPLATP